MSQAEPPVSQDPVSAVLLEMRAVSTPGARLSKEQQQFNKLVNELDALRATLAQWQQAVPALERRVMLDIEPLFARYRERRLDIAMRLRGAIDGDELSKREKTKASEILCWHLSDILSAEADGQLIALYNQYAGVDYEQAQAQRADAARRQAAHEVARERNEHTHGAGRQARPRPPLDSADLEADDDFDFARRAAAHKRAAKAALGEQLADGAGKSVREIYRKLASALHPDREFDVDQQRRKTALMQQANLAYEHRDLLTLLGLQLQLTQFDSAALGILPRERLLQYNHLLGEQCRQLRATLAELTAPFLPRGAGAGYRLTQDAAERALDSEVRQLKRVIKACEAELVYLRDMRNLKALLDDYRLGELDA